MDARYLAVKPTLPVLIEKVQGQARAARGEHTISPGGSTRRYVKTEMHLGGRIFVVPDAAFSMLEDGAAYALYVSHGTQDIFSLEVL